MPFAEFILQLLSIVSVPLLFLFVILTFKKPIYGFLTHLSSVSAKGAGAELTLLSELPDENRPALTPGAKQQLEQTVEQWKRDQVGHLFWLSADINAALSVVHLGSP